MLIYHRYNFVQKYNGKKNSKGQNGGKTLRTSPGRAQDVDPLHIQNVTTSKAVEQLFPFRLLYEFNRCSPLKYFVTRFGGRLSQLKVCNIKGKIFLSSGSTNTLLLWEEACYSRELYCVNTCRVDFISCHFKDFFFSLLLYVKSDIGKTSLQNIPS